MKTTLKSLVFLLGIFVIPSTISAQPCSDCDLNCITCESIDGFSATSGSSTPGSSQGTHCTGREHQITWVGFIAGSEDLSLEVCADDCRNPNNTRLEVIIIEAVDCTNASAVSNCYGFATSFSEGECRDLDTSTDLVVGEYYWLVFDNTNGTGECDYSIAVTSGETGAVDLDDEPEIEGETILCTGDRERFIPEEQDGVTGYIWTLDGDDLGEMDNYLFRESRAGVYELCATPFNFCYEGPESCIDVYVGEDYEETFFFEVCKEDGCVEWEGDFYCWEGEDEAVDDETWLGCDSIIYLDITYYNPIQDISIGPFEICEGEEFDLEDTDFFFDNGYNIVEGEDEYMLAGTYMVTVEDDEYECEYYIEFTLDVLKTDSVYLDIDICENEKYLFAGEERELSGIYDDRRINNVGCDSFTFLTLNVLAASESNLDRIICKDQPVIIADTTIRDAGVYKVITPSANGCDSTITVSVTIADTIRNRLVETICEGDSIFFTDTYYSQAGQYRRALISNTGCDSVVTLDLQLNNYTEYIISPTICEGQEYEVAGRMLTTTGIYEYNIPNAVNCDSFISVDLFVIPTQYETIVDEICEGDSTLVGDSYFKTAGNFSVTTDAVSGCDSIITLNLGLIASYSLTITETICEGDSIEFEGTNYLQSGQYSQRYTSIDGCDSVLHLNLNVLEKATDFIQTERCDGDIYLFGTEEIMTSGFYERYPQGPDGCDSLIQLDILFLPVDNTDLEETICNGDSTLFLGEYYHSAGMYTGTITNQYNCDSTVILDLRVRDQLTSIEYDTFCNTEVIPFGNIDVSSSGSYEQTFVSKAGCDSLVTLNAIFQDCSLLVDINKSDISCNGYKNGSIRIDLINHLQPLIIEATDPNGNRLGTADFKVTPDSIKIDSLCAGNYDINILDGLGVNSNFNIYIQEPEPIIVEAILSNYSGFEISCNGASDGSILVEYSGGTSPFQEVTWSDGGEGALREGLTGGLYAYFATDANGCSAKGMTNLLGPTPLDLNYDVLLDPCDPEKIELEYETSGGIPPFSLDILSGTESIEPAELQAGSFALVITDINDCSETYDLEIPRIEIPELFLDTETEVMQGETISVSSETEAAVFSYNWTITPEVTDVCLDCVTLEFTAIRSQYSIELNIIDENGCSYISTISVDVDLPLAVYIPNILNTQDPLNNQFRVFNSEAITLTEFRIYSRWGELIYDPDLSGPSEDISWDGTRDGQRIEPGVYVYVIKYLDDNDEPVLTSGDITVF